MKIILKQEVDNLGLAGDVVDVADGYGRNFLLPRGLAIKATKNAMKEAETITRARKAREAHTLDDAQEQKAALESRTYRIAVRVDDAGHLYGSVRAEDVHRVIKDRGHDIEKRRIDLKSPIKMIGNYEIDVRVHPQVYATIALEVVDEEGKVQLDASGRVIGDEPEEAAPTIEEMALEAAAEIDEAEATEDEDAKVEDAVAADAEPAAAEAAPEAEAAEAQAETETDTDTEA